MHCMYLYIEHRETYYLEPPHRLELQPVGVVHTHNYVHLYTLVRTFMYADILKEQC